MRYKVTKQYARGTETQCAQFDDVNDAKAFIQLKLEQDRALKVSVIYRIKEFTEVIEEFDPARMGDAGQSSQGQSSSASFRPTPFNTAPKPAGTPQKWTTGDDDEKKK